MKRSLGVVLFMLVASNASAANVCVSAADKGQDLRAAGKLDEARASFLVCARPSCNRVVRADCERWIKEIDATPAPAPPPVSPPEPAPVALEKEAPAAEAVRVSLAIHAPSVEEDRATSSVPSSPAPISSVVLGGIGVASLAAFGFFQVQGWSRYSDLDGGCGKTRSCTDTDIAPVRSQFVASGVALGISAVALGAAAILYFTRGSAAPSSRVGLGAQGAALSF